MLLEARRPSTKENQFQRSDFAPSSMNRAIFRAPYLFISAFLSRFPIGFGSVSHVLGTHRISTKSECLHRSSRLVRRISNALKRHSLTWNGIVVLVLLNDLHVREILTTASFDGIGSEFTSLSGSASAHPAVSRWPFSECGSPPLL